MHICHPPRSPGRRGGVLTTSVLIAVVPAVIVSITLPLRRDAGTLSEGAHRTREVAPTTGTLGAAGQSWAERRGTSERSAPSPPKSIPGLGGKVEAPSLGALLPRRSGRPRQGDVDDVLVPSPSSRHRWSRRYPLTLGSQTAHVSPL